jgi:GNAT superfamily N-acetyltransferase
MEIRRTESGAEAWREGERIAFLYGTAGEDEVRGRHVWSSLDDHGLAPGEDPEVYRDLYAVAGERWLTDGYPDHYVVVPADDAVLATWGALGFAQQQVHGARATTPEPPRPHEGFTVRLAGVGDLDAAMRLAYVIYRHIQGPPVWSAIEAPGAVELRESWRELLEDPGTAYFLAERDTEPLGHLVLERQDDETVYLAVAATGEDVRGLGVGVALTEHALRWAHGHGYKTCVTDWRAASVLSARFWPRRGFLPTAYRLVRFVGR